MTPMTFTCDRCGSTFTATTTRARWCSEACRSAAKYARNTGRPEALPTVVTITPAAPAACVEDAVRAELVALDVAATVPGALALHLARTIDTAQGMPGSGVAALSKELRIVMETAARRAVPKSDDIVTRLRRKRIEEGRTQ